MSEKKVKKVKKKSRTGSEASSFDQKTIQEFKEAFAIMDQDKDGVISKGDLKDLYATLGSIASESQIDAMLKEAPGPINFTVFLTLFGERLTGTDPEATIIGAFQMWDKSDSGFITEEALMKILKNKRGEPLSEDEVQSMYKGNPPISGGKRCTGCQHAMFCDKNCQSLGWKDHKFECKGIKLNKGQVPDIEVRLLGRIVSRHKAILCGLDKKDPDFYKDRQSKRKIMEIWAHTERIKNDEYAMRKFEGIYERLCRFYDPKAMLNKQIEIGKGLYLDLCAYDHSCRPNTVYSCHSFIATLRSLDSKVNLLDYSSTFYSYIDLLCAKQDRRKLLKEYKNSETQLITCPSCNKMLEKGQVLEAISAMCFISDVTEQTNFQEMGEINAQKFLQDLLSRHQKILPPINVYMCKIVQALLPFIDPNNSALLLELHLNVENCLRLCYPHNHPALAFHLRNIGIFAKKLGQRQKALNYLGEALDMFKFVMGNEHSLYKITEEIIEEEQEECRYCLNNTKDGGGVKKKLLQKKLVPRASTPMYCNNVWGGNKEENKEIGEGKKEEEEDSSIRAEESGKKEKKGEKEDSLGESATTAMEEKKKQKEEEDCFIKVGESVMDALIFLDKSEDKKEEMIRLKMRMVVPSSAGTGILPKLLKMESQPIFASGSAPFSNLPMRKMNRNPKIMATSTGSHKAVTTTTKEKVSVDNKAFEPKHINGFAKKSFDTKKETHQAEKLNTVGVVKQEKSSVSNEEKFTEFNGSNLGGKENLMNEGMINKNEEIEEKLKKHPHHLKKQQEGKSGEKRGEKSGEKGVEFYKNYITKKVAKLTAEIFVHETTETTPTTKTEKNEDNVLLATDLLMNIPQTKRENYKTKAAELAFVLNVCEKFIEERGFVEVSEVILGKHANPQPDFGTFVRELKLIPKLWALLGVQNGYKQENYYQYVVNTFERLSNLLRQGSHYLLFDLTNENKELYKMKEEAQKKLELTKRCLEFF
uniref:Uncharacterized protein n=1 Tax=Meloidogyne javanica TaxID=6303 RepID=A0A915N2N7_MELJA